MRLMFQVQIEKAVIIVFIILKIYQKKKIWFTSDQIQTGKSYSCFVAMALLQDLLLLWFYYVYKQSYYLSKMVAYTGKYQTIVIDFAVSENAALSLFNFH